MKKTWKIPIRESQPMKRWRDSRTGVLFPDMSENPWLTKPGKQAVSPEKRRTCGLTTLELCAGAGGQALGYEQAGIEHLGLVELDKHACATLRLNRSEWKDIIFEQDLNTFDGAAFKGADIISGGLPCPPFSVAGKQLGTKDERNLFPAMIRLVDQIRPKAVMIENVRGFSDAVFIDYRLSIKEQLRKLGYVTGWKLRLRRVTVAPQSCVCGLTNVPFHLTRLASSYST